MPERITLSPSAQKRFPDVTPAAIYFRGRRIVPGHSELTESGTTRYTYRDEDSLTHTTRMRSSRGETGEVEVGTLEKEWINVVARADGYRWQE
ncbi:MAG TPA: hypothetical protein VLB73_01650 [Patescibacteria group bacterium]|nr:hypothetical protein [Patescibacteria group bacterium]